MHLRSLRVRNVKLLRDVSLSFTREDGSPRMWTVLVGENRLCKTTLLQAIAAAASGRDRGSQLVSDVVASWPDLRNPSIIAIDAEFGFSKERDDRRTYPGYVMNWVHTPVDPRGGGTNGYPEFLDRPTADPGQSPPQLKSSLSLGPKQRVFEGSSAYLGVKGANDPLGEARSRGLSDWFVAGYGPARPLSKVGATSRPTDASLDRLRPLFGERPIATGFIDLFDQDMRLAFAKILQTVLIQGGLLPHITGLELRGRGGVRTSKDLEEAQRFEMDIVDSRGEPIRVPALWLSHGYQSVIAWLSDLVGQVLLEAGAPVEADKMEGIVLVDEIDLHLHPVWQVNLIPALKKVFPALQFVVTTHSPMVLPGLAADEVWMLSSDPAGSVLVTGSSHTPQLLTGSELYADFFGIKDLYPHELGNKLKRYGRLANDPTRSAEEEAELPALRAELEMAGVAPDWQPVPRE